MREAELPIREQLVRARSGPGFLAERLGEALEQEMVKDPEIRRKYQANFSKFSPEVLAELTLAEGAYGGSGVVQKFVATSDDAGFVHAYLRALGDDADARRMLLQHLGADSVLLGPDSIAGFLDGLPALSASEWRATHPKTQR